MMNSTTIAYAIIGFCAGVSVSMIVSEIMARIQHRVWLDLFDKYEALVAILKQENENLNKNKN